MHSEGWWLNPVRVIIAERGSATLFIRTTQVLNIPRGMQPLPSGIFSSS